MKILLKPITWKFSGGALIHQMDLVTIRSKTVFASIAFRASSRLEQLGLLLQPTDGILCFAQQIASVPSVAFSAVLIRYYSCRTTHSGLRGMNYCGEKYTSEILSLLAEPHLQLSQTPTIGYRAFKVAS